MANVPKRLQSDDIENLAIGMEQLSQEVQDILAGGGGFLPAAAGDLVTYDSNAASVAILSVGSNGQVLTADSTAHKGIKWADAAAGSPLSAKGQLYGYGSAPLAIDAGSAGYVLTVDFAETSGLKWVAPSGGSLPTPTVKGQLITYDILSGLPALLSAGTDGQVLTASSSDYKGIVWATPLPTPTTKGQLVTYDGNTAAPGLLARGTNGLFLKADSTQDKGLIWDTPTVANLVLNHEASNYVDGDTIALSDPTLFYVCRTSADVSALTLHFTSQPVEGTLIRGMFNKAVTTLTINTTGGDAVEGGFSSVPSGGMPWAFIYSHTYGIWFRCA